MLKKWTVSVMLLASLGNLVWPLSAKADFKGKLTVEINELKNKDGQLCISLFSSSQGFPSDRQRVLKSQCNRVGETPVIFSFDNLKVGSYAVAVFHDRNGDGKLNSNNLGIPSEPFGFSRNPEIRTGVPKFADAAFVLAGPNTIIQIQLKQF